MGQLNNNKAPYKIVIIIPARFNSSRFPGKPLHKISGISMIRRVVNIALLAVNSFDNIEVIVATDDERIREELISFSNIKIFMTKEASTGSDRIYQVVKNEKLTADYIINYQGDAPLIHPKIIIKMIEKLQYANEENIELLTPYMELTWYELDELRKIKAISQSSSGTMVIKDQNEYAIWFSKNIIPNITKEKRIGNYSPILRHIGLYAYRKDILEKFVMWPESYYEKLEELEQLRVIENGHKIKLLNVTEIGYPIDSGIDKFEDIAKAEKFIEKYGEFFG